MAAIVRRMQAREVSAALGVWHRSLTASFSELQLEDRRSEQEHRTFFRDVVAATRELWVAVRGSDIAGVMALLGNEIDRLYIDPPAQGLGLGSQLVAHAKSLQPGGLWLVTLQRNARARRFYERHGFIASRYGVSPAPESQPDVVYRWPGVLP